MRKHIVLLFTAIMLFTMTACGGSPAREPSSSAPASSSTQASKPALSPSSSDASNSEDTASGTSDSSESALGPNGEPVPNQQDYEATEVTVQLEFTADNSMKIIVHDPYLASYYYIKEPLFSLGWEVSLDGGIDIIASVGATLRYMEGTSPAVVDASGIQNEGNQNATLILDFDSQTLTWEIGSIGADMKDRIVGVDAIARMTYGSPTEKEMTVIE